MVGICSKEVSEVLPLNTASCSLAWKRLVGICSIRARASLGFQIAYGDPMLELLNLCNTICGCSEFFNINNVELDVVL
ncbi:hypothetical protein Lal_00016103 [Lupinus albus]|nr:hypothetical protein Lal_00016103 [Lupinus albus]